MTNPTRRDFVKTTARAGGALGVLGALGPLACAAPDDPSAPPTPRRILILGGTRFIGPYQVRYALDRGHEVSIFTRGRTEPPFFHDYFERVEHLIGDRDDDLSALEGREWDAVIDNSASIPRWVSMTAELLHGNVDRYLFVSSISAYADFATVGIDETYPVGQLSAPDVESMREYGPMKARCEAINTEVFGENAINVRPGLIIGPGDNTDRWTYWPVRVARGGEVLAPSAPADRVQNIDGRGRTHLPSDRGHGARHGGVVELAAGGAARAAGCRSAGRDGGRGAGGLGGEGVGEPIPGHRLPNGRLHRGDFVVAQLVEESSLPDGQATVVLQTEPHEKGACDRNDDSGRPPPFDSFGPTSVPHPSPPSATPGPSPTPPAG